MNNASIANNLIEVTPSNDDGEKRLTVSISNGWDDCKKICKKILQFEGNNYAFIGWNSDTNKVFFKQTDNVAKIK